MNQKKLSAKKGIVGILLTICMVLGMLPAGLTVKTEAAVITKDVVDGAISWGSSQMGSMAYDGYCQKFVNHCFMNGGWGGVSFASARLCGDALITNTSVSNVPRGAVVFFDSTDHNYGHIGISLGDGTMLHAGHKGVEVTGFTDAAYLKSWYHIVYRGWGVWGQQRGNTLEPDTPVQPASIQVCTELSEVGSRQREAIANARKETNWGCYAYINNPSGAVIGEVGIILYDNAGNQIGSKSETYLASANRMKQAPVWYDINEELGVTLTKATDYQYKFYANVGGQRVESAVARFTTAGTADTPAPAVSTAPVPIISTEPVTSAAPTASPVPDRKISGDVNGDGTVNLEDAQLVLKAALRITSLLKDEQAAADMSGDGQVTLEDARLVLKAALRV